MGFLQALLLGVVCSWLFRSDDAGAKVLLIAWPALAWRRLAKPATVRGSATPQPLPLSQDVSTNSTQANKTGRNYLKKAARISAGTLLAFCEAVALSILAGCLTKSFENAVTALLLGWPVLIWRRLRKLSIPADQRPPLARRMVVPLLAVPVILAVLLYTIFSSVTRGSGSGDNAILALIAVGLLSGVFYLFWGGAIGAFLLHRGAKKKKKS